MGAIHLSLFVVVVQCGYFLKKFWLLFICLSHSVSVTLQAVLNNTVPLNLTRIVILIIFFSPPKIQKKLKNKPSGVTLCSVIDICVVKAMNLCYLL